MRRPRGKGSKTVTMKSLNKAVSNLILKKAEPKHKNADFGKSELYHNLMSVTKLNDVSTMPVQGTGDSQRVGDNINLGAFYIRMLCGQKIDRPNVTWRFIVAKLPKGTPVSYSTIFDNITGNVLLDSINKDKVKVLKSLVLKKYGLSPTAFSGSGANLTWNAKETTFPVKLWVPYRKLYKFMADAGTEHTDDDIYLLTFVYDAYGSLVTDNIAYAQITSTIYYKDP